MLELAYLSGWPLVWAMFNYVAIFFFVALILAAIYDAWTKHKERIKRKREAWLQWEAEQRHEQSLQETREAEKKPDPACHQTYEIIEGQEPKKK